MTPQPRPPFRLRSLLWWALGVILAIISLGVFLNRQGIIYLGTETSPLEQIRPEQRHAFVAPTHHSELSSHEHPSSGELLENGQAVFGPGDASHDDIRNLGGGRYSFWFDAIYFSSTDNSPIPGNGRRYEIRYPVTVGGKAAYPIYALTFLVLGTLVARRLRRMMRTQAGAIAAGAGWRTRVQARLEALLSLLGKVPFYWPAALVVLVFVITRLPFFLHFPVAGIAPDSGSYEDVVDTVRAGKWPLFVTRTPGYPFFIWLVTEFSNRWIAVIAAQSLLSGASVLTLVYGAYRFRAWLAVPTALAMCGFLGSSHVLIYETFALSESVYTSCLLFSIACFILALARRRAVYFALGSAAMAYGILVRPAGSYLLVIYLVAAIFLFWNRYRKAERWAFTAPLPAMLLLLCAYNYRTIGSFVISPYGEANLAGATLLFWEQDPRLPAHVNQALRDLPESYRRSNITADDFVLLEHSWNTAQLFNLFAKAYNTLVWSERWGFGSRFGSEDYLANRKYIKQASVIAIERHPKYYAKFVWTNVVYFFDPIAARYEFYGTLQERAKEHYSGRDRGYALPYAKEYLAGSPPPAITLTGHGTDATAALRQTFLRRMHEAVQSEHWAIFQRAIWKWIYVATLVLSTILLVVRRGRDPATFLVFLITLYPLGASLVVSLVELSIERYSYPTEFVYYLSAALFPLLWCGAKGAPTEKETAEAASVSDPEHGLANRVVES